MPAFEAPLIEIHADPRVPWTAARLDELLHTQDLRALRPIKQEDDNANEYLRMLPQLEGEEGFVLRVKEDTINSAGDLRQSERQLKILGGTATRSPLIAIPPHRTFLQEAPGKLLQPYRNCYTVVRHVDGGANLRERLQDPTAQTALLRIGTRLTTYFGTYEGPGDERLIDISSHYQYSPGRKLYDLAHYVSDDPREIGDDLHELQKWASELLPSRQQSRLLERAVALCERWPIEVSSE